MPKHKAPTQVTIASTHADTAFHRFVERYWKLAAGLAVAIALGVVGWQFASQRGREEADASWDRLAKDVSFASGFGVTTPNDPAALAGLAEELKGGLAGPWARALEVKKRLEDPDGAAPEEALSVLEREYPGHPIVAAPIAFGGDEPPQTLPAFWRSRLAALERWEADHAGLFANPPLPAEAPRVRLHTSAGPIVVGLDAQRAPKHVENFLKHCREGFYDGTRFHRVIADFMIQAGDPNTRTGDPATWGQGGPGYTIEPEIGELRHYRHVLAAAKKPNEEESSGSQFYITTDPAHHLDGIHTVFGTVLEGAATIEAIAQGTVIDDRPQDPVVVTSTEVLP